MKCFNHRELDAIAVCRHCGRALCPACVAESAGMSACKGRCEAEVAAIHSETQFSLHSYVSMIPMFRVVAFLGYPVGLVGIGIGSYALVMGIGGRLEPTVFVVVGIGLIALGHSFHKLAREFKSRAAKLP
jgi:hypothetical protein